jgi:foldase protein PrsA
MKRRKKPFIILAVILVVVLLVAGYIKFFNGRLIYFTTGMKSGELIKTAGQKTTYTCEADILMSDVKKEYEEMFGSNKFSSRWYICTHKHCCNLSCKPCVLNLNLL